MVEYLLLGVSNWGPDIAGWFETTSGWYFLGAGAVILVVVALATR